jgi:hypothetical protein
MKEDDRTTPLGLFDYARSYWQSGVLLHHVKSDVSNPDAPVSLLFAHAMELYLKAFLRLKGVSVQRVKSGFGHDFRKLVDEASARGLPFTSEDSTIAAMLTEQESIRHSNYIETGHYRQPKLAALSRTCSRLDEAVGTALDAAGIDVRPITLLQIEE